MLRPGSWAPCGLQQGCDWHTQPDISAQHSFLVSCVPEASACCAYDTPLQRTSPLTTLHFPPTHCAFNPETLLHPPHPPAPHQVAKVPTAVLSTTVKARERAKKKEAEKEGRAGGKEGGGAAPMATEETDGKGQAAAMETDESKGAAAGAGGEVSGAAGASKGAAGEGKKEEKEKEAGSYSAANPARIVPAQAKVVSLEPGSRWVPVRGAGRAGLSGIIVMRDTRPGEAVELVAAHAVPPPAPPAAAAAAAQPAAAAPAAPAAAPPAAAAPAAPAPPAAGDDDEPPPPAPFEYRPPQ